MFRLGRVGSTISIYYAKSLKVEESNSPIASGNSKAELKAKLAELLSEYELQNAESAIDRF